MKKLLICCLAILLAGAPTYTVNAANLQNITVITDGTSELTIELTDDSLVGTVIDESFRLSTDSTSMTTSITMEYEGQVIPARSVEVTRTVSGRTYKGTLYLTTFRYLDGVTSATYEGTLYLVSDTSTS